MLRRAFNMFSDSKTDTIENEKVEEILKTLGHSYVKHELTRQIKAEDLKNTGRLKFDSFVQIMLPYLPANEDEDDEIIQQELKEAFKLYDKAGMWLLQGSQFMLQDQSTTNIQTNPRRVKESCANSDCDKSRNKFATKYAKCNA